MHVTLVACQGQAFHEEPCLECALESHARAAAREDCKSSTLLGPLYRLNIDIHDCRTTVQHSGPVVGGSCIAA